MKLFKVKKIGEQKITVDIDRISVIGSNRDVVISDPGCNEDYKVTITGDDVFTPLKVGQNILADLRCDPSFINNEWKDEYYLMYFQPLEDNAIVEYVDDWTTRLV